LVQAAIISFTGCVNELCKFDLVSSIFTVLNFSKKQGLCNILILWGNIFLARY
jgi:hypothetical protein